VRVLFITNLFPYPENEMSGIFITNRLKALTTFGTAFEAYGIISKDTFGMKILKDILRRKGKTTRGLYCDIGGIRYNYAYFNRSLLDIFFDKVLNKRNYFKYADELANKIYKKAEKERFDIIHAHGMYTPPAGLVAKLLSERLRIPYVVTCHGSDINLVMLYVKELYNEVLEKANKVIFVSNALLNKAKLCGYSGNNAVVIPNGIEPKIFKPLDKEKIKKELNLSKKVVGFVGGLKRVKRTDKFPEIFENISSVYDVDFLIVGDGELKEELENECKKRNLRVIFIGQVSQDRVAYYMNAMDVMILPSRNEGFGVVVIEAQACGVPVAGSSNGGIPEAIGDGGIVVEEGEDFERRFAEAVVALLENPVNADYLRRRALEYSWESIVEKEVNVYKEVLRF